MRLGEHRSLHNRTTIWLLVLLILFAVGLRLYRLGKPSLHGDEAFSAQFVAQSVHEIAAALGRYEPNPPFYYALLKSWLHLAGRKEFSLRFLSAWWGILLVPWVYDLGKRLGAEKVGATAALLAAINPFLIWHSQEARMYAVLATLSLVSVVLLVRAKQSGRRLLWWAWAMATWLTLLTHYFAAFLVTAEVGVLTASLAWSARRDKHIAQHKAWILPLAVAILLYLPWAVYVAPMMLAHEKGWIEPVGLGELLQRAFITYSLGSTAAPWAAQWLWPVFLLTLVAGGMNLAQRCKWETGLLTSCLLAPLTIVYLLSLRRPMFHERYLIFVLPLYLLFLASGITALAKLRLRRPQPTTMVLVATPMAFLIGASGLSVVNYFHNLNYAKSPPWREMVCSLLAQSQPDDVVIQNYPDPSLTYYLEDRLPYALVPANMPFSQIEIEDTLTELMNKYHRLWLVPTRSADWDATGFVETWLDRHNDLIAQQQFGPLRLRLYLSPTAFLGATPPLARLDETVQLLGYRLSYESDRLRPGDVLYLSLYWQTSEPLALSYKVFTHLLDPAGRIQGQQDNPPVGGTYPTTEWQPDEVIVDRYEIAVRPDASPGIYRLAVGMYDGTTMKRIPVQTVTCRGCTPPAYASEDRIFLPVEIIIGEQ